jgi:drug/metabolite transporter (DMT)-like permease
MSSIMPANRDNLVGIVSLVIGIFVFSIQDTIIKYISGSHAVTLAVFLRSIVSFPILLAMVAWEAGLTTILSPAWKVLFGRGFILFLAYISYYTALAAMPIGEVTALFSVAPIIVTTMSGTLLGERVSAYAWLALAIGMTGTILIVRPGTALFNWAAILPLFSAATYAYAMVLARKFAGTVPTTVMSFYQNVSYILASPVLGYVLGAGAAGTVEDHPSLAFLIRPWSMPNTVDLLLMMACGVIAAIAATLLTHAYRKGQASVVTPFEYTSIMWGSFWGFLLFNETLSGWTLWGMALIAAAGIVAIRYGRVRS